MQPTPSLVASVPFVASLLCAAASAQVHLADLDPPAPSAPGTVRFGKALAAIGDVDHDGVMDVAIAAEGVGSHFLPPVGWVTLYSGADRSPILSVIPPVTTTVDITLDAAGDVYSGGTDKLLWNRAGTGARGHLGASAIGASDADHDGTPDFATGAPDLVDFVVGAPDFEAAGAACADVGRASAYSPRASGTAHIGQGTASCAGPRLLALLNPPAVGKFAELRAAGTAAGELPILIANGAQIPGGVALLGALLYAARERADLLGAARDPGPGVAARREVLPAGRLDRFAVHRAAARHQQHERGRGDVALAGVSAGDGGTLGSDGGRRRATSFA